MEKWTKPMEALTAVRFSSHADEIICAAAKLENVTRSQFIRQASIDRAKRLLRRQQAQEVQAPRPF
jgi:uncharacterized protein (DUF1778 family)